MCAPPNFSELSTLRGLSFQAAGRDFRGILDGPQSNSHLLLESLRDAEAQYAALKKVAAGCDLIVATALQFAARTVAEELSVPYRYAVLSPMYLRSTNLPSLALPFRSLPGWLHRLIWRVEDSMELRHARWLRGKRRQLGVADFSSLHLHLLGNAPVLGAFDPVLGSLTHSASLASPMDTPDLTGWVRGSEWYDGVPVQVTGYWRLPSGKKLSRAAEDFLASGPPPVYMGFGSMRHLDSRLLWHSLIPAVLESGQRVVVGRGWADSPLERAENLLVVDEEPHDLLFPRVAVAVHHGGAGTTVAAAIAGVPQLIVPHLGDQLFHGLQVARLGIGVYPIPLKRISPRALMDSIGKLSRAGPLGRRATEFAVGLREREGSALAAEILEQAAS
jgi:UDP:flavonoid glycosyltransferase YjiC (YdhE family)